MAAREAEDGNEASAVAAAEMDERRARLLFIERHSRAFIGLHLRCSSMTSPIGSTSSICSTSLSREMIHAVD